MSAPVSAVGNTDAADVQTAAGNTDNADSQSATGSLEVISQYVPHAQDMPGQVDSQRGRSVYSASENAAAHVRNLIDGDRYLLTQQMALDAEAQRRRDADYADFRNQRLAQNQQTLQLNLVAIQQLSGVQVANLGDLTSFVAALGQMLEKTAGTTPPVTVSSPKAS